MEVQLKKGLIEFCVLAVLQKSDSYGYQIIKEISECIEISGSTLYPILKRLEISGCLETYSIEYNSRLRKYYHITKEGKTRVGEFICDWNKMEKIFDFIVKSSNESNK